MIKEITSTQNKTYKYIKSLKQKKERLKNGQYTVEGLKSVKDAMAAGADIAAIAISDKLTPDIECETVYKIPDALFSGLCDTETPQGILAVINIKEKSRTDLTDSLYLYCDRVTDPGNIGTIIRICDAAGCGLLLSAGCADIYSPKTVRASMGSFFHTEIVSGLGIEDLKALVDTGYKIISGALNENTVDFKEADYSGKCVIVAGNEANGVSREILDLSDECVKIPIFGKAESLNVGVAAALMLYEAKRNRI